VAICDSCKRLAATSRRSAVPAHLLRIESGSPVDQHRAHYRCLSCQSQWRWVAPATWVLFLPPASAKTAPGHARAGWWMALGQLLSGARPSRRGPIEMRVPRLPPRTPSLSAAPSRKPVAKAVPAAAADVERAKGDRH
jgi:hypothetical protein